MLSPFDKANDYHAHDSFKLMPFRSVKYADDFTDENAIQPFGVQ